MKAGRLCCRQRRTNLNTRDNKARPVKPLEQEKQKIKFMLQFSDLTIGTAVANQSGAMEADTISKNGRSLKSQMSRGNFFRVIFFCASISGLLLFSGCNKDDEETSKGYNFTPPSSWTAGTAAGGIETFTGTADGGFNPNMNIVTENFNGTLKEYVDGNINSLNTSFDGELVSRASFQTNGGLSGEKLVYLVTYNGINLRFFFYIFPPKSGSKTYVIITSTGLASYNTKYDATFDAAAQSFAWK